MDYIHINCDLGEGGEQDELLMKNISACNIACGGHAGTKETMRKTVGLALENNVEMGAHPSYPDKGNFGRKSLKMSSEDLKESIVEQIQKLQEIIEAEGGKLHHIKPHGALYNDAAKDEKIAEVFVESVLKFSNNLPVFTPENSAVSALAKSKFPVIFEAFADRNYEDQFQLVSRQKPNAILTEREEVFDHLFRMFRDKKIRDIKGRNHVCNATTFCLHSDTPKAVDLLKYLSDKLSENDIRILNT